MTQENAISKFEIESKIGYTFGLNVTLRYHLYSFGESQISIIKIEKTFKILNRIWGCS